VLLVLLVPLGQLIPAVIGATLALLLVLGGLAARMGGAPLLRGSLRVAFWGAVAMGVTALVGHFFGGVAA
ncbi:MAG TPA: VIT1/CCC1 transporter family protein, partial [Gemmatimonadales bacterium]|nr:VIT1/CCC1 transporter family protein [Gemmatimonadales bacterium]